MHERFVPRDRGGDAVTTDIKDELAEGAEADGDEKSFFARGALLGLVGGALVAVLLISVGGSVISLIDDVFGSDEVAADAAEPSGDTSLAAMGEQLATTNGCVGCHSANGLDGVGPTWSGLFGSERVFVGGGTAVADDAYLLESIVNPGAAVVEGFADGVMPTTYGDTLPAEDIEALIAYIKSL